jgi:hypothetical protein
LKLVIEIQYLEGFCFLLDDFLKIIFLHVEIFLGKSLGAKMGISAVQIMVISHREI